MNWPVQNPTRLTVRVVARAAIAGCAAAIPPAEAPVPISTVPAAVETAPAVDPELLRRCEAAARHSERLGGEALVVMLDGRIVFERYADPKWQATPHLLASGTKSFAGIAATFAIEDGLLSLDERVADTIDEWKPDPRKSTITVRQLLSLSAGLDPMSDTLDNGRNALAAGIRDRAAAAIAKPLKADPGRRFLYGPASFYVFGELLRRKLAAADTGDRDAVAYLERKLFRPLGIEVRFLRDAAGNPNLAGGGRTTARDWARLGEWMRRKGEIDGKRLLPEARIDELLVANGPNERYGLTWWLLADSGPDPEETMAREFLRERFGREPPRVRNDAPTARTVGFMAAGKGKQRLYVLPDERLVVVRFGPLEGGRGYRDAEMLTLLIPRESDPTNHLAPRPPRGILRGPPEASPPPA
jgi:CubicO group peptidase (beta-lactamase class C family)